MLEDTLQAIRNNQVTSLNLEFTGIGGAGVQALADALRRC